MVTDYIISKYSASKWVLTVEGRNIIVNQNTVDMLDLLKRCATMAEATERFNEFFKANLTEEELKKLAADKFGGFKVLIGDSSIRKRNMPAEFRLKFEFLPSNVAGFLATPISLLFNPRIFCPALLILAAIVLGTIIVLPWPTLAVSNLLVIPALVYPSMLIHELGHIAACKRFGVKHGGVGFGVYWVFPVMYADVDAIWTAGKKERIIVNLGGIYAELLYASILTCLFFLTNNSLFFHCALLISFSAAIQVNPFVRLDGYWILSDLTETPNLLQRSNSTLAKLFEINFLREFIASPITRISRTERSKFYLLAYSVLNNSLLAAYLLWSLYRYGSKVLTFPIDALTLLFRTVTIEASWNEFSADYLGIALSYLLAWSLLQKLYRLLNQSSAERLETELKPY